jgi:RimJ/RimL family protein N-acetyltransferase
MIKIRPASLDDLPTLLAFEQGIIEAERPFCPEMQQDKFHYYDLAELINKDNAEVLVAEAEGKLVASGYAEIRIARQYLNHGKISYLGFMYVDPEWRGQGLNQKIVGALFDWSHKQGVDQFVLDVFSDNTSAVKAYEKLGFKPLLTEMILHRPES